MLRPLVLCLLLASIVVQAQHTAMEVAPLYNRPASHLQPIISPLLEQSERVIANGSSLIIKATPSRLEALKDLITQLDTPLKTLTITVLQTRTKTARSLNAAADTSLSTPAQRPSKLSGHISGRFAQTEGFKNLDQSHLLKTLEGHTASIRTGKVFLMQNISNADSRHHQPLISRNTQLIAANTGFTLLPRLTGNQVTLQISPWSDKLNPNGVFNNHQAHTTIRVKLGEWVEIGGMNQYSQSSNTLSHAYTTANNTLRILIKIEKD